MSFEALIAKVRQAETALESREREATAQWQQLSTTWRAAWTPGRIVLAGLASGYLVGRARPLRVASGGGVLQMLSALSGMLASGSAQAAAGEAEQAATQATVAAHAAGEVAAGPVA
jgi:hypothetical protein